MEYGIRELSQIAGVSARTLRYYDEIGLLKPLRVSEAGYRFYGEKEMALLQQILFYRERNFDLKRIRKILYQGDFDIMNALKEHLQELEEEKAHLDSLIWTVKQTISSMKGENKMSDKEKFAAFKEKTIKQNEEKYGKEVREKYGDEAVNASNKKIMDMSETEWEEFHDLEAEIRSRLEAAVKDGLRADSQEAGEIVRLHKSWLMKTWKNYTSQAHKGVALMYDADPRFREYYDRNVAGCAKFLGEAVDFWAK